MRKLLFLLFILVLPGILLAQEFNGGLLFGFDMSEISSDRVTGPNRPGLYTGIFTSLYVSERSSLQMELDYIQKGSRKKAGPDDGVDYKLRLHYIEMQFLYHYDIKRFTLEAGPSLGYLAGSHEEKDYIEVKDDPFYPLDLSLGIGLYYRLTHNLQLAVRYSNSILPVRDRLITWTYFKGEFNEVLSLTAYWTIWNPQN